MGDLINLRRWRKRRVKDEEAQVAAQNREVFGQSRQERAVQSHTSEKESRHLDGHKLEPKLDDHS